MRWGKGNRYTEIARDVGSPCFSNPLILGRTSFGVTNVPEITRKKSPTTCILLTGFADNGEGTGFAQDLIFVWNCSYSYICQYRRKLMVTNCLGAFVSASFLLCWTTQLPEPLRMLIVNRGNFTSHPFSEKT